MKRSFFQAAVTSILLYGCTTWTLTKRLEKKLDGNYTRMLRAILNKSWQRHPTRHQLYGHLPPITKSIQVRRTRHAGHCWRSRDELIRDVLLWIPTHGRAKAGRPARTYIQQLCEDTGCCPEDLPRAMNDREEWRERVRDIRAASTIWWWWWPIDKMWKIPYIHLYTYIYIYEVHAISFKTFLVWAFKIVVDSWKFSMLLQYTLWDDWPICMISGSNEQLQQQLEYTLLKPDWLNWWISKMESDILEERYAKKFCFKLGKNATETYGML